MKSVVIPVKTDMSNTCCRHEAKNSLNHSESCSENGNESQLFPADMTAGSALERSFNIDRLDSEIDRCFVSHQHRGFVDKLLENLCWSFPVTKNRQLVLNERMPDNCQRWKFFYCFDHRVKSTCEKQS